MKHIGIVTLYGEVNYGNRLQNYAMTRYFEKNGVIAQTISKKHHISLKDTIKTSVKTIIGKVFKNSSNVRFLNYSRQAHFIEFTKRYIPTKFYTKSLSRRFFNRYDRVVVGSDQVWNPCFGNYEKLFDEMFLVGIPDSKKACFAPSFGVSSIPEEWRCKFADALNTFPILCAREQSGVEIIRELTGKTANVMIDPTLMLDAAEWLQVAAPVNNLPENYVLDYFLGDLPDDTTYSRAVANEQRTKRIRLLDLHNPGIYISGPAEFVYLISKASLICTDSFHACVFSILFNKPFAIFKRRGSEGDMFSRLHTLLGMFGIDADKLKPGDVVHIDPQLRDEVLETRRHEVQQYFFAD